MICTQKSSYDPRLQRPQEWPFQPNQFAIILVLIPI
jgi:hypothetical protein